MENLLPTKEQLEAFSKRLKLLSVNNTQNIKLINNNTHNLKRKKRMNFIKVTKWMLIIENLYLKRKTFGSKIARDTNITYNYATKTVNELMKVGYVNKTREGRQVWLELTDEGIKLGDGVTRTLQSLRTNGCFK